MKYRFRKAESTDDAFAFVKWMKKNGRLSPDHPQFRSLIADLLDEEYEPALTPDSVLYRTFAEYAEEVDKVGEILDEYVDDFTDYGADVLIDSTFALEQRCYR